ncbi:hypothetical protein VTJ49DRAFT_1044 [Mycothermus thermophilus]|uniref:Uncharacterized protein n=1 Tax=Humicola insolens TaxID=85995 RepID=A0ABR3VDB0_HUMIN
MTTPETKSTAEARDPLLRAPVFSGAAFSEPLKEAVLEALWPQTDEEERSGPCPVDDFDSYFEYLEHQCSHERRELHAIQTFDDVIALLDVIKKHQTKSLDHILDMVRATTSNQALSAADEDKLLESIEFVVRCWLMINVCIAPRSSGRWYHIFRGQPLPWPRTDSLSQAIQRSLAVPSTMDHSGVASGDFPDIFNVVDMKKIVGFKVMWTNNLGDHLVVRGRFVYLFSQELSDAFDNAKPRGMRQWLHDRRDMGQWWNYWFIVMGLTLTVLFGLIQSVTGILQVINERSGED